MKILIEYVLITFLFVLLIPIYTNEAAQTPSNPRENFDTIIKEDNIINIQNDYINVLVKWDYIRDLSNILNYYEYKIKEEDTLENIAKLNWLHPDTIRWANKLKKDEQLKIWSIIKIPPTDWLLYKIQEWDTLSSISLKYDIDLETIKQQNKIQSLNEEKKYIFLPWWQPIVKQHKLITKKELQSNYISFAEPLRLWMKNNTNNIVSYSELEYPYELKKVQPQRVFYPWHCTWYVSNYKNVSWSWNANEWLINARNNWVRTWQNVEKWAIVVFNGSWYNINYWHVWIVVDVNIQEGYFVINEMNYTKLYEITTRKIKINDPAIKWFIYAE